MRAWLLSMDQQPIAHHVALQFLRSRLNQVGIYTEDDLICLCRVAMVDLQSDLARFHAAPILAPGVDSPGHPWCFGAALEFLHIGQDDWTADYPLGQWRIDFNLRRIQALCQYAAGLDTRLPLSQRNQLLRLHHTRPSSW